MPFPWGRVRRGALGVLAVWTIHSALSSQTAPPVQAQGPEQQRSDELPVFRTTSHLVTIDAIVTDKDGRHVTDLTAADFELTYRGRRQELQHAVYVSTMEGPGGEPRAASSAAPESATPGWPREQPTSSAFSRALGRPHLPRGRTIAVVVDDLGLSFRAVADTRRALRRFVDTQVEPGDLVAIIRTSGGMGALQQFTTDRRLLHTAIERLRWSFASRHALAVSDPSLDVGTLDALRERVLTAGSLGAIGFIARGMQALPGRKAIVLLTQGFGALFEDRGDTGQGWRALERMLDHANRAGVAIYTVDPGGLQTGGLAAEHHVDPRVLDSGIIGRDTFMEPSYLRSQERLLGAQAAGRRQLLSAGEQLTFVAQQTGGLATVNNNDLNAGFSRALEDQRGYYLLGFQTQVRQASAWEQGAVEVRVNRPGLRVRSRQGRFGPADPGDASEGSGDPLLMAALSPFGAHGIPVRLTALFGHDAAAGPYVRTMLFIDAYGLTFTRGEDGRHLTEAEIAQVAIDDNGQILDSSRRTLTLRLTDDQLEEARTYGVIYGTRMSVKKPGAYQIRTSVQDKASARLGSASQFLEVPEVRRGRLALSGVLLQAAGDVEHPEAASEPAVEQTAAESDDREILGRPSLRIFRPGSDVAFAYEIYDGTGDREPLEATASLLRDGKVLYRTQTDRLERHAKGPRVRVIPVGGRLSLGAQIPPGAYTLEVSLVSGKKHRARQWADFDVQRPASAGFTDTEVQR